MIEMKNEEPTPPNDPPVNTVVFLKDSSTKQINISATFTIRVKKDLPTEETKGMPAYSCAIPAFDLFYSASTMEEARLRGRVMVRAYMRYWLDHNKFRGFVLELGKRGFKGASKSVPAQWKDVKNLMDGSFENLKLLATTHIPTGESTDNVSQIEGEIQLEAA